MTRQQPIAEDDVYVTNEDQSLIIAAFMYEASDGSDSAVGTVTIDVKSTQDQVANVTAGVVELAATSQLTEQQASVIVRMLNRAIAKIESGDIKNGIQQTELAILQVEIRMKQGKISEEDGLNLIADLEAIIVSLQTAL